MRYIADTAEFQIEGPTIVTLGEFGGKHRGHQKLLPTVQELKSSLRYPTVIFTFGTPPLSMMSGQPQTVTATSLERRVDVEKIGTDYLVEYLFSEETRRVKPEGLVKDILVGRMQAEVIVVDPDCSFEYKGTGDAWLSKQPEEILGYRFHVIEKERDHLRDINNTYTREELEKGDVEKANAPLGEPHTAHGEVAHGSHIGVSILGFPTTNLLPLSIKRLPRFGVYAPRVLVDGTYYRGITNIGRRPTVKGRNPVGVGTYIFDIHQNPYGKVIEVQLLAFDRPEQRFSSLEEPKWRIEMDKVFAAGCLERYPEIQVKRQAKR